MPDTSWAQSGDPDRELLRDMSERATLLYWNSDQSVNSIAEGLGLSKGRFYELIRPLKSGDRCPICQSDLVFDNRTARDRGETVCPSCDSGTVPELSGSGAPEGVDPSILDESKPASSEGVIAPLGIGGVVAGLLIGTVAGVLIGRAFRR